MATPRGKPAPHGHVLCSSAIWLCLEFDIGHTPFRSSGVDGLVHNF